MVLVVVTRSLAIYIVNINYINYPYTIWEKALFRGGVVMNFYVFYISFLFLTLDFHTDKDLVLSNNVIDPSSSLCYSLGCILRMPLLLYSMGLYALSPGI